MGKPGRPKKTATFDRKTLLPKVNNALSLLSRIIEKYSADSNLDGIKFTELREVTNSATAMLKLVADFDRGELKNSQREIKRLKQEIKDLKIHNKKALSQDKKEMLQELEHLLSFQSEEELRDYVTKVYQFAIAGCLTADAPCENCPYRKAVQATKVTKITS